MTYIEELQGQLAEAAQEAALLEAQARVAAEVAAQARAHLLCLQSDLEAAMRTQAVAALRAGWRSQPVDLQPAGWRALTEY